MSKPLIQVIFTLLAGSTVPGTILMPVIAGQFSDGRTFFDRPPSLIRAATSNPVTRFPSTYLYHD